MIAAADLEALLIRSLNKLVRDCRRGKQHRENLPRSALHFHQIIQVVEIFQEIDITQRSRLPVIDDSVEILEDGQADGGRNFWHLTIDTPRTTWNASTF